jgi:hypothetical protein
VSQWQSPSKLPRSSLTATNSEARKSQPVADWKKTSICLDSNAVRRLGAFGISFGLPVLVYLFTFSCNDISGCPAPSFLSPKTLSLDQLKLEVGWPKDGIWGLASWEASGALAAYYLLNLILYAILPAQKVEGTVLRSGGRLKYRFNSTSLKEQTYSSSDRQIWIVILTP